VNGLGRSPAETLADLARFQTLFHRLDDTPAIYPVWEALVASAAVVGKRAHDARLVAAMMVHGLTHLLTFNDQDFRPLAPSTCKRLRRSWRGLESVTSNPYLTVAESAARAGGAILSRYFESGVTMRSKFAYNLVSDADLESEHAIVKVIRETFPDHEIIGEEAHKGDPSADRLWIIDPLDGTTNFAHHIPQFAVSIAYYEHGQPVMALLHNPIRDDWYRAVKGQGATFNGRQARTTEHAELEQSLIGLGFYYDRGPQIDSTLSVIRELLGRNIHCIRRFGAASLDLAMVGTGQLDAYFELALEPWDFGAGRLFVEEAGGTVTTCSGGALGLEKTSVLATNGGLHPAMLEVLATRLPRA
jgi:myo-inositol-1(or 4)-monophosphatase